MPAGLTLGKATVNGFGAVTVAFLCRVPDKRHSAKRALPINFLPCVLCRVQFGLCRVPQALDKEPESSSEYKSLNALRLLTIFWFRAPQCAIYWFRRSPYEEQSSKLESVCRHEGDSWDPLDPGTKTHTLSLSRTNQSGSVDHAPRLLNTGRER